MKNEAIPASVEELYEPVTPLEDLEAYRQRMLSYHEGYWINPITQKISDSVEDKLYHYEIVEPTSTKMAELVAYHNPNIVVQKEAEVSELEKAVFKKRTEKIKILKENQLYATSPVAVHATNYFPENGVISPGGKAYELENRETIHFSLNGVATVAGLGETKEWEGKKYFVVAPLYDLMQVSKPIGGSTVDFFFAGKTNLPETAKIFSSKKEAENFIRQVSKLRAIGNDAWCGKHLGLNEGKGEEFMRENGLYAGMHSNHWTREYSSLRYDRHGGKAKLSHEEALAEVVNRTRRRVTKSNSAQAEKEADLIRLRKEIEMFGYEFPEVDEAIV